MSIPVAYTLNILRQYKNQMVSSRTLAYRQHALRAARGEEPQISPEAKRQMLVQRVAREVFTNLLAIGSENPVVLEASEALNREFGTELEFCYLPGELEMVIYRKTPSGGTERLSPNEQTEAASRAWKIILKIVDEHCF